MYTKCNFFALCNVCAMLINVQIVTYVVRVITLQKEVHQNQTSETVDNW